MANKGPADKWDLLSALYLHGTKLDALSRNLPHWSRQEIDCFVTRYRRKARRLIQQGLNEENTESQPLQQWTTFLDHCHKLTGTSNLTVFRRGRTKPRKLNDHSVLLNKVMTYAAYFEDHFNGTGPDDVNYSEIYRYLAQLLAGEEPTQLRPASAAKILEMLDRLRNIVLNGDVTEYLKNLQNVPLAFPEEDVITEGGQTPGPSTKGNSNAGSQGTDSCPLFDEPVDITQLEEVDAQDPYYDYKKDLLRSETEAQQRNKAKEMVCVPGLNPLGLSPSMLVKTFNTVPPAPHASYIYKSSGKQPESALVPH